MINKIYHLADIHIRLYKRHQEYQDVFDEVFRYIQSTKEENDIIVLAGDIVHSKTDMSPEMIQITSTFLKDCADLLPTILILGNHDLNLQNPNRLDALTPIVNSLNHSNLYFWKDSGVYEYDGVKFSVMSVLGTPEQWIWANQIDAPYKIALHHGALNAAVTDLGYVITNELVTADKFAGFDIVLLGDIHLPAQYMNSEKTIAYPGSLIGQGFGEGLIHGILVWDVRKRTSEFVQISNQFGYVTFEFKDGVWINSISNLPKNLRCRVKYTDTTKNQIIDFFKNLGKSHTISQIIYQKRAIRKYSAYNSDVLYKNVRDIEHQNQLIIDFLVESYNVSDSALLDGIRHLNRELNSELKSGQSGLRSIVWKLKKFWFSNMFSYGDNNFVNFDRFDGIIGLVGQNAQGKSSLLNALCFCLFDKSPVGSKGIHILNTKKKVFNCKIEFELDGTCYTIERRGTKNEKTHTVKVDVDFSCIDSDGNVTILNGEDRDDTNRIIREYIGSYEDFLMISLSSQIDNQSFIEKTQRERKELLYKFLDISIFENLWKLARDRQREVQFHIKELDESSLQSSISNAELAIETLQNEIDEYQLEIADIRNQLEILTLQIHDLNGRRLDIEVLDIKSIEDQLNQQHSEIDSISRNKQLILQELEALELENSSIIIDTAECSKLKQKCEDYDKLVSAEQKLQIKISKIQSNIQSKKEKIAHLEQHEYDPDCSFCVQNPFVQDAKKCKNELAENEIQYSESRSKLLDIRAKILENNTAKTRWAECEKLKWIKESLELKITNANERINTCELQLKSVENSIRNLEQNKRRYYEQEIIIIENSNLEIRIRQLQSDIKLLQNRESELQDLYRIRYASLTNESAKLSKSLGDLDRLKEYTYRNNIYELFIKAVSKEGVPYKILTTVLPVIEYEANEILSQLVDFTIKFEAEDDKNIFAYIVYSDDKYWSAEMSSGMERFLLSQSIRVALSNISNLPRPNFIAIDEGFGTLDSDNLNSVHLLFDYLRDKMDFMICISHIDAMRDIVDNVVQINKIDGFSEIMSD
jgi:DNA repair exonuclease SbcCD ATPase subunit/predicted phosphodiesterase